MFLPNHDIFVHFLNKLQKGNEFSEQPIVISSVIGELRNKQQISETSEVIKVKSLNNQHHWLLRELARINAFQYTFSSQLTVLDTVTIPKS